MRKKQYEITDMAEMANIMEKCMACRIALNDGDYPYIVPLNFGYSFEDGVITLYFHSAGVGKKIEMLKENGRVGFEMDTSLRVVPADLPCDYAMEFESIVGKGEITFLEDEDKPFALQCIMNQYAKERGTFTFPKEMVAATTVMKLTVREITCKRIMKS